MAAPNEKLAASLAVLRRLQKGGRRVFRSQELASRSWRDRMMLSNVTFASSRRTAVEAIASRCYVERGDIS
jgi:hypothetical protein